MQTSIEQLPIELWIVIFSYLEAHDLLRAFTKINRYFDQLIDSEYLLFNARLGKERRNPLEYAIEPYWSNTILNRIVSLQPIEQHKCSHIPEFLRWHATKLTQLRSLDVKLRGREISPICMALRQLDSLVNLTVECVPSQILIEAILSAPALRVCRCYFLQALAPIHSKSNRISKVEKLYIDVRNDSENEIIKLFLNSMPHLKQLEIHSSKAYFNSQDSPFCNLSVILQNLHTIKIYWSSSKSDPKFFDNLHEILPNLKFLYLNFIHDQFTEVFFNNLLYHWWPFIENIPRISVLMKYRGFHAIVDNHMQTNLDKCQSNLLAMNQKYHGLINFEWTERFFVVYKMIEISINSLG